MFLWSNEIACYAVCYESPTIDDRTQILHCPDVIEVRHLSGPNMFQDFCTQALEDLGMHAEEVHRERQSCSSLRALYISIKSTTCIQRGLTVSLPAMRMLSVSSCSTVGPEGICQLIVDPIRLKNESD